MDTAKTIDLTRLCIQITKKEVFPIIHTLNLKRHPKPKNVNSKPKVLSTTMFRISRFRTTYIHIVEKTDSVNSCTFPNQLTMFSGILLKTF